MKSVFAMSGMVAGLVLGGLATAPALAQPEQLGETPDQVLVAAHRGCWQAAPENSVLALERCKAFGIDIVEVDLRLTSDGHLVNFHDSTLNRMAGRPERIEDLTLAEITAIRLRDRDGRGQQDLTEHTIPTFEDMLDAAGDDLLLILDMKGDIPAIAREAARILAQREACDQTLFPLVAAPDEVANMAGPLLGCAGFLPNLRTPMGEMSTVALSYTALDPIAVAVRFDDWSYLDEGADEVQGMGARIWVNTLNRYHAGGLVDENAMTDPDQLWGRLVETGVTMIQTDEPEALIAYLHATGRR